MAGIATDHVAAAEVALIQIAHHADHVARDVFIGVALHVAVAALAVAVLAFHTERLRHYLHARDHFAIGNPSKRRDVGVNLLGSLAGGRAILGSGLRAPDHGDTQRTHNDPV